MSSSGTDSQSVTELFSPQGTNSSSDASPGSGPSSSSPHRSKTPTLSSATATTGNSTSVSSRKMNLDGYRQLRATHAATSASSRYESTAAQSGGENRKCGKATSTKRSESSSDVVGSSLNTAVVKPRIKLKIGSQVVVETFVGPPHPTTDADTSREVNCVARKHGSSSDQFASRLPNGHVNGKLSKKLNLPNVVPSVECSGLVMSSSCSSQEESDLEPLSKRARTSFKQSRSAIVD